MSLYVIGIGGTGAKCIEAIVTAAAVGLFTEQPIRLLFVDPDNTNGNLERSKKSIRLYQDCFELIQNQSSQTFKPWFKTKIEFYGSWSPVEDKNLDSFFTSNNMREELGYLYDVLYPKKERELPLSEGFRGRPAIGSAILSQVDLDRLNQEPWYSFIQQITSEVAENDPKIFLCGSIFGGTGASGLPTVGRLIANKLNNLNIRNNVSISGLFFLPYFHFSPPPQQDPDKVYARWEEFLLNTEAALRYYTSQAQQTFDIVYLLGNQKSTQVDFHIGRGEQRNEPHFIELYGALAARHFLESQSISNGKVALISRQNLDSLTWSDLPNSAEVKQHLSQATRFAYTWLSNIVPDLSKAGEIGIDRFQRQVPWFSKFYRPNQGPFESLFNRRGEDLPDLNNPEQQDAIQKIREWCESYLKWLYDICDCDGEKVQLFKADLFKDPNNLRQEELRNLVLGDNRDRRSKQRDTVQALRHQLDSDNPVDVGTVGLAKALYQNCRL